MPLDHPIDAGSVTFTIDDGVATLSFSHPKGNSLPAAQLRRLADAVETLAADRHVRVVILRSDGTGPFCGGASFDELRALRAPDEGREFFSGFARVILAMRRAPQFIVTRVHGKAVGGGVGLVAASDYAIALEHAAVRLSELAIGIGPFVVGPVIERKIGHGPFAAMAVDFDWRDAEWAQRVGLYARVEPNVVALDAAVEATARRLVSVNPAAVAELKATFRQGTESWDELLFQRAAVSGRLILTSEAQEALARLAGG